jgi:hypothetical protein
LSATVRARQSPLSGTISTAQRPSNADSLGTAVAGAAKNAVKAAARIGCKKPALVMI